MFFVMFFSVIKTHFQVNLLGTTCHHFQDEDLSQQQWHHTVQSWTVEQSICGVTHRAHIPAFLNQVELMSSGKSLKYSAMWMWRQDYGFHSTKWMANIRLEESPTCTWVLFPSFFPYKSKIYCEMLKLWLHYKTNVSHKIHNKIFVIFFGLFVGLMTITKT